MVDINLEKLNEKYPGHKFDIFTDCLFCDNKAILQELSFMNAESELIDKLIEVGVAKVEAMHKGFSVTPKRPTKKLE